MVNLLFYYREKVAPYEKLIHNLTLEDQIVWQILAFRRYR